MALPRIEFGSISASITYTTGPRGEREAHAVDDHRRHREIGGAAQAAGGGMTNGADPVQVEHATDHDHGGGHDELHDDKQRRAPELVHREGRRQREDRHRHASEGGRLPVRWVSGGAPVLEQAPLVVQHRVSLRWRGATKLRVMALVTPDITAVS